MQAQNTDEYVVDPRTGCWIWQKNIRLGYGRACRHGRLVSAHVWYYEQKHGPVPAGMDVDHMCHNRDLECPGGFDCIHRRCVNPDHLALASRAANVRRGRVPKLTAQQVAEIRAQPWVRARDLAEKYGGSASNIIAIRTWKTWRDVAPAEGFTRPVVDGLRPHQPRLRHPRRHSPRVPLGAPNWRRDAPLTDRDVAEIKATPRYYGSGRELSHKYGVPDPVISAIRTGHLDRTGQKWCRLAPEGVI